MTNCIYYDGKHRFNGYGVVSTPTGTKRAHRIAWEEKFGQIPKGLIIDHVCHNEAAAQGECQGGTDCPHRACINTDHLRVATPSENILSGMHSVDVKQACPQGHSYKNPRNIMTRKNGTRECAECNRERARRNWANRFAKAGA